MNGQNSRYILLTLAASVALSLAPQTVAQESASIASVAATETANRQYAAREALQKLQEARTAYTAGRYGVAVDCYRAALEKMPKAPATEKQVKFIKDSLADALVAKGMDYRTVGRIDEAVAFMKEAMVLSPGHKFAKAELARTQDPVRTNPALTPQHVGNVAEVNRLLTLAYGYYELGNWDKALETFDAVLRIDAYNSAAQRGKELTQRRRQEYYKQSHDTVRAEYLADVDKAWEEPLPVDEVVSIAATESGSVVHQDAETENRMVAALKEMVIPRIVFEDATVNDVLDALRGQISRFESQGVASGRPINIIPNFGAVDSPGYQTVMSRHVNLNLENISLFDLLNILDKHLGITHYITPIGVELSYSGRDFGPMVERVYSVPPHFFDAPNTADEDDDEDDDFSSASRVAVKRINPVTALKEMGVSFPEGANARYDASTRMLTVRNTAYNHEEIEELISMPLETDRAVVLNVMAMEVAEDDLNELGFEWMFNFHIGPKAIYASGTSPQDLTAEAAVPTAAAQFMPQTGYSATEGLRSGKMVLAADNIDSLISNGRAGMYGMQDATQRKAPGIFAFRGVWNSGDVTMIMRGVSQKKGTDIMTNPRIVLTPGRDEQVVFANVKEMFYPETYSAPQMQEVNMTLPGRAGDDGAARGRSYMVSPAHPESFVRYGMVDDTVGGIGSVVQVHEASVSPDGQLVTLALTFTINEFEGFVNWGSPIHMLLMKEDGEDSYDIKLSDNMILQPIFKRRMENTKLTVGSGSVVVMGGLKEARSVRYEDKLPILGDLPMVGRLFRSEGEEKIRKAYLVFVKVDIIDPTGRVIGTGEKIGDIMN